MASIGNSDQMFSIVNSALATTEYDDIPEDDEDDEDENVGAEGGMSSKSSTQTASARASSATVTAPGGSNSSSINGTTNSTNSTSSPASNSTGTTDAQSTYIIDSLVNMNTVPSSGTNLKRKRSSISTGPSERTFLLASTSQQHRFVARHRRAARRTLGKMPRVRRGTPAGQTTVGYTPEQSAIAKGYSDGWNAAKTFASFGSSRLGQCSTYSSSNEY